MLSQLSYSPVFGFLMTRPRAWAGKCSPAELMPLELAECNGRERGRTNSGGAAGEIISGARALPGYQLSPLGNASGQSLGKRRVRVR
jgi:hypothetical protein